MKKITARIISGENTIYIYNNIDSAEIESLTKGDLSNIIDYGIYSNKGTISFFDYDKSFHNLMETNPTDVKVQTYASNPVSDKLIGTFLIDDYDYDDETKLVSLTLKDKLLSWQKIDLPVLYYYYEKTLLDIVEDIMSLAKLPSPVYTISCEELLSKIYIYCTFLENETVWSAITKVCQAAMCRVCANENGIPTFYSDDVTSLDNIIVRSKNILSIDNEINRRKNALENVLLSVKSRTKIEGKVSEMQVAPYEIIDNALLIFRGDNKANNPNATISELNSEERPKNHRVDANFSNIRTNVYDIYEVEVSSNLRSVDGTKTSTENNSPLYPPVSDVAVLYNKKNGTANVNFLTSFTTYSQHIILYATSGIIIINGRYFEDDEDEKFYTNITDSDSKDIVFNSNELMQTQNYMNGNTSNKYYNWFLKEAQRYKNGVYCCEMDCLVTDYYDLSNNIIINGDSKTSASETFSNQDVVVPYVTRNGIEQPYKTNSDGSNVAFTVVGIKYLYNGILTQKLLLQEITPQNNLIHFYINNTGYFTYEGDTWEDFANRNKNIFYTKSTAPDNLVTTQRIDDSYYNVYSDNEGRYMTYDDIIVEDGIYRYVEK